MLRKSPVLAIWLCSVLCLSMVGASCEVKVNKPGGGKDDKVDNPVDGACGNIDIRNSVEGFKKLENCTVIEGKLHILLIDHAEQKDYEKFRFPLLREITGHLLLYRVYGLLTLRHIFPNLTVIRGQDLFYNYALVVYEMPDLEELGLVSLTTIMRGAVRLTKNTRLCYIDTIDWSRIAVGLNESDHHIEENKDETKCVNICPDHCQETVVNKKSAKRCWTSQHCQKSLDCNCESNMSACVDGGTKCCHKYCIGGCTEGGKVENCIACRNVIHRGECLPSCPPKTYLFMQRRCLTYSQCINLSRGLDTEKWKILNRENRTQPNECVDECPTGYIAENQTCIKCNNSCPKVCYGNIVDSIDSAQKLKDCNKIVGPLEIQIMGGSNVGTELEESLGNIEEVTQYIKVIRSYALLSLHFFKNLRVIGGEKRENAYSLTLVDNSNMQELFTENVTKHLKILEGKVFFHGNRKLCHQKIQHFVDSVNLTSALSENEFSKTTNGDQVPCEVKKINLRVKQVYHNVVVITWEKASSADDRQILSYVINYRPVTTENVNIYQGRDACSDTIWKTSEIPFDNNNNNILENSTITAIITHLKPWTKYAVYVQAYMINQATQLAMTDVIFFTTSPDYPTSPADLKVIADEPGELELTWKEPKQPNGNVTHYIVYWQAQDINPDSFDQRNYCVNPIDTSKTIRTPEEELPKNESENCCECPKSKEELYVEERERQIEIEFENYLHDHVYCKRSDSLPSGLDERYNLSYLAGQREKRQTGTDPSHLQNSLSRYSQPENSMPSSTDQSFDKDTSVTNSTATNSTSIMLENPFLEATVNETHFRLTNLNHFQEYNIEVLACHDANPATNEKLCSNRAITVARTQHLEYADNINVSTVQAIVILNSTGEVLIKWEPPPYPNGIIIRYHIQYRRADQEEHLFSLICISPKRYREHNGTILTKIEPGNYTYQIAAVSLASNGSYTIPMYFYIPRQDNNSGLNETYLAVSIISVLLVIIITIVIVWFIAKSKFSNLENTVISQNPGYMPSEDLYKADEWELDRDKIVLVKELGQGSFGMVYEGYGIEIVPGEEKTLVAIKTVNENSGIHDQINFLKEATTMKAFNCYHVVKLLGVVSKTQPVLVIMELMARGDLKNYLRMHRPDEEDNNGKLPPTVKEILQMAGEIADGMAYLADKKFVHRDLAARNCMVSDKNVVKIGDFGMTRDIYETDYYRKGGKGLLPVRWMAPESLKDGVFTTMSDVWSYGVVLWEMATLATQPYQGLSNEEVVKYVGDGNCMARPHNCPDLLHDIMHSCWQFRPKKRPTFKQIIERLVPELDPNYQHVSYFFSDENRSDGGADTIQCIHSGLEDLEGVEPEGADDIDFEYDIDFAGMDASEESSIPFMAAEDPSHRHPYHNGGRQTSVSQRSPSHGKRGASASSSHKGAGASGSPSGLMVGAGAGSPCECVMMEELPNGHRLSNCSSPTSTNANSDGSKGSSKSSSSYSHINGLANGHILNTFPRTAPC